MEKNGELVEIDDESSMTRVHYQPWNRVTIHQSRNGGWRGDFFVLRRILINRFVSFRRFAASNPLERFRLHHLSVLKEGRAPLSSTRYIIRDFCQSPSSRGHRGRRSCMKAAPGLRALCLWFHNFRRRDVRRSRRERERRDQNLTSGEARRRRVSKKVAFLWMDSGDGWTLNTSNVESIFNPLFPKIREEE